jgi:hypothetical protein
VQNVEEVLAAADREWHAMGVVAPERATLARDLRMELEAAAADGVPPERLLDGDVRAFARAVAVESGATRLPYEYRRLLLAALAGAAPALVVGWFLFWGSPFGGLGYPVDALALYALVPPAIVVGALLAVRRRMRDVAAIGRTVAAMAVLVPLAGVLVTPVIMGFAWLAGYSTALSVIVVEAGIVAAALSGAVVLARRWALAPALRGSAGDRAGNGGAPSDVSA